jgi:hypothetical protein
MKKKKVSPYPSDKQIWASRNWSKQLGWDDSRLNAWLKKKYRVSTVEELTRADACKAYAALQSAYIHREYREIMPKYH